MRAIRQFLTDISTSRDGTSFDVIRVGMIVSVLSLIGFAGYDLIVAHNHFDPLAFGSGCAAVFAGGGAGIMAKRRDEPPA